VKVSCFGKLSLRHYTRFKVQGRRKNVKGLAEVDGNAWSIPS